MNIKTLFITSLTLAAGLSGANAAMRYSGGDISLLSEYDKATYYSPDNKKVADFLTYCAEEGMNSMRVRLFVNPSNYTGSDKDANAKQDIEYIIPICKRIKEAGCSLMLDFHYSDTWADPVKQWTPSDWVGLSDSELNTKIYEYTKEALKVLEANGITPDFIQTGNEISYGMLWGAHNASSSSLKKIHVNSDSNWTRFKNLLSNAVKACREVCPEARIVIHTERVAQTWYLESFYERLKDLDYDIIGLSYYPYFHGSLSVLDSALTSMETNFPDKEIMVVETGYSYAWDMTDKPVSKDFEYSEAGQKEFSEALVETLLAHESCTGLYWWWMEYNAYGTSLSGWYNAPLVDSRSGKISSALPVIASYAGEFEPTTPKPEEPNPEVPTEYPDFYVLANNRADWTLPGTMMTHEGDGIYTVRNLPIIGHDGGNGWFALTTSGSSNNWTEINNNRYGPSINDTMVVPGVEFEAEKCANSWEIAPGFYNLTFDYPEMLLTVEEYQEGDGDHTTSTDTIETEESFYEYYTLQGTKVTNPGAGIYIRVSSSGKAAKIVLTE